MNSPDYLPLGLLSLDTFHPLSPADNLPRREYHHMWNSLHPDGCSILLPELELPPSPSDTCSSASTDPPATPSPRSHPVHIVCRAPLVAPIPLPYHSPTFLQFELPDLDQDLSHPPYTKRTPKRKREDDLDQPPAAKRRVSSQRPLPSLPEYAHIRHHTTTAARRLMRSSHRHS
ncbi:hypothetical protein BD779DRAFT_1668970 [Infundibulicybe gibba]|nr:hypothetical protein BD779DRAFT_1668970 [Infundibulicybe gibba]